MKKSLLLFLLLSGFVSAEGRHRRLADAFFDARAYSLAAEEYRASIFSDELVNGDAAEARVRLGASYQHLGDYPRAVTAYRDFLDVHAAHPQAPEAWLGLSLSLQALGRYADSLKALKEMLKSYPQHPLAQEASFAKGENLYFLNQFQEAEKAYAQIGVDYPDFSKPEYLVYARAWCFYRMGQSARSEGEEALKKESLSKAMELFGQAADSWPDSSLAPNALYQQGESAFALPDYKAASVIYKKLESKYPSHPMVAAARYSLAWCAFQAGQWRDASTAFHKFAVVHEDHELAPWAMYLAGVSLARAKDYALAQSAYEITIKKYSDSGVIDKARYGLAWLATVRRDYPAAIEAYGNFLDQYPQSDLAPSALFLTADALYHQERYATAREDYLALLKKYPTHPLTEDALFFVASCSLATGEYARARDEFSQFFRAKPDSPYASQALLKRADAAYGLGDLKDADEGYRTLLKSGQPDQVAGARSGLAWIAFQNKNWHESYTQWKRLAEEAPQHPLALESLLHAGDSLYNLNRYGEARDLYRACVKKGAGLGIEADAHYQAGWASYRMKDFDQAYGEWSAAASQSKDETRISEARYWMAWALFRKGQFAEAAQAFGQVHEQYAKSHLASQALLRQADSLYNARNYDQAIKSYQDVVNAYPNEPITSEALHGIQWCYYALGKDEEAVAASKAFLEKNKSAEFAPEVQYRVAEHYLNRSDFKQAEKELDTLKSSYPGSKEDLIATYWRGQARFKNLRFNEAIQDWKQVVSKAPLNPLSPRAQFKIGMAYYRLQEYPEALAAFDVTMDSYGNTVDVAADAVFNKGMTFKRMRRDPEAIAAYTRVIRDYPQSPLANMARMRIGYTYEDAADYEKAIAAYRDLASNDSGKLGAEAQYLVGDCYLEQKKFGEALLAYGQVVESFKKQTSWVVTAFAKIGEVEEAQGHDAEALAAYESIVKLGGDPKWVDSATKRMDLIRARTTPGTGPGLSAPGPKRARKSGAPGAKP